MTSGLTLPTILLLVFAALVIGCMLAIALGLTAKELSRETLEGFGALAGMLLICAWVWSL